MTDTNLSYLNEYSNNLLEELNSCLDNEYPASTKAEKLIKLNNKIFNETLMLKVKDIHNRREISAIEVHLSTAVAGNKSLTNETSRRAAKEEMKANMPRYTELQKEVDDCDLKQSALHFLQSQIRACLTLLNQS